jgi:agarase
MNPTAKEFPDVFAPEFDKLCDDTVQAKIVPRRDDPWVLGWAFTDTPIFTDREATPRGKVIHSVPSAGYPTWPRVLRNLPASAPGKQAWLATIRERYRDDFAAFSADYGTSFATWSELLAAEQWRANTDMSNARELSDNAAFLEKCVDRYYTKVVAAIRAHDPHHLIFGDKLNANTDATNAVLHVTERHCDVVFYQMYGRWEEQRKGLDEFRKRTRKPLFNGDSSFAVTSEMMPSPYGPHARDQVERGEWTLEYAKNAFAERDFVGWTVCGWVDTWKTMPGKEDKQHAGFFGPLGEPHTPYIQRLREISDRLYEFCVTR